MFSCRTTTATTPPTTTTCTVCGTTYVRLHTCHGGRCPQCHRVLKDIRSHRCPVTRLQRFLDTPIDVLWKYTVTRHGHTCGGCWRHFPVLSNINVHFFCGEWFCADCYHDTPEIQREVQYRFRCVLAQDLAEGKTRCALCTVQLLDPLTGARLVRYERDHVDPRTKVASVGTMCVQGDPIPLILTENRKCRNLCIACHSVVTFVQRHSGIMQCYPLQPSCLTANHHQHTHTVVQQLALTNAYGAALASNK